MRVLLILPPNVPTDGTLGFASIGQPLDVGYRAAAAGDAGHDVEILDALEEGFGLAGEEEAAKANLQRARNGFARRTPVGPPFAPGSFTVGLTIEQALERMKAARPQVVGVSAIFTGLALASLEIMRGVKPLDPGSTTVVGGAHPTLLPEQTMGDGCVHYLARREREKAFAGSLGPARGGNAGNHDLGGLGRPLGSRARGERRPDILGVCYPDGASPVFGRPELLRGRRYL